MKSIITTFLILATTFNSINAQEYYKGWHLGNLDSNRVYGANIDKTYKEIIQKASPKRKIIVAVIDSGIDTTHEDLKSIIWTNKKEIPSNGIDDDKNGYVDDVHGWNFIGGKDGRNVGKDSYEGARIYYKLKKIFGTDSIAESTLDAIKLDQYKLYKKLQHCWKIKQKKLPCMS